MSRAGGAYPFRISALRGTLDGVEPLRQRARGVAALRSSSTAVVAIAAAAVLVACNATIGPAKVVSDAGSRPDAFVQAVRDATAAADAFGPGDALPDAIPCEGGDRHFFDSGSGHCYLLFTSAVAWSDARADCANLSAHLATSTNRHENVVITALAAGDGAVWLGGTDASTEGFWVWVTGESMGFQNWGAGEPNGGTAENCMALDAGNSGAWDDRPCSDTLAYVCERD